MTIPGRPFNCNRSRWVGAVTYSLVVIYGEECPGAGRDIVLFLVGRSGLLWTQRYACFGTVPRPTARTLSVHLYSRDHSLSLSFFLSFFFSHSTHSIFFSLSHPTFSLHNLPRNLTPSASAISPYTLNNLTSFLPLQLKSLL